MAGFGAESGPNSASPDNSLKLSADQLKISPLFPFGIKPLDLKSMFQPSSGPSAKTLNQDESGQVKNYSSRLSTGCKDTARFESNTPRIEKITTLKNKTDSIKIEEHQERKFDITSQAVMHKITDNSPSDRSPITGESSRIESPSLRHHWQGNVSVKSKPPLKLANFKPVLNSRLRTPMYAMTFREMLPEPVPEDTELLP